MRRFFLCVPHRRLSIPVLERHDGLHALTAIAAARRLSGTDAYLNRHIGSNKHETEEMLELIGKESLQDLVRGIIPAEAMRPALIHPFHHQSEMEVLSWLRSMGMQNRILKNMIGQGYYECTVPPALIRNVLENPMWYTPYVPTHPEISQGRLEALLNFQTVVIELTKMDIAGAAAPCQATACSEAMAIAYHHHSRERKKFVVCDHVFPASIANMKTRAESLGIELTVGSVDSVDWSKEDIAGLLVQTPSVDGSLHDFTALFKEAQKYGVLCCCATDLLACTVIVPPGEMGADVVVGSSQRLGMPLGYGGPHAAFIALKTCYKELLPGHLVGISHDAESSGPAMRLVLRHRETYTRREKATSNIDNAPFLPASMTGFYAMYHGPKGLKTLAFALHRRARMLMAGFKCLELPRKNPTYFDTITLKLDPKSSPRLSAALFVANCVEKGINVYHNKDDSTVSIAIDERTTDYHISLLLEAAGMSEPNLPALRRIGDMVDVIPPALLRTSKFLSGIIFQTLKSETEMMRYVQRLQRKDFGLTHGMIPMGSCTMKLNSAVVVRSLTWPEFTALHPYAPDDQTRGINTLIVEFKQKLCDIFGMAACSIQPNSAAQGLYAGIRVIQAYHKSQGKTDKNICLVPKQDLGTNAASAAIAGLEVVYIDTADNGLLDMQALEQLCAAYNQRICCIMLTYPSVCGVYDTNIVKILDRVHAAGGQCFVDGINMNAMVGYTGPGFVGGDVCTIPLHKTFSIPHGSGGAGIGSLVVRQHLAPFLPNSVIGPKVGGSRGYGVVSQSGFGSASMVCVPHSLIQLLGSNGLKTCTDYAILNANYLRKRLEKDYTIFALTEKDYCAHQFILDLRSFEKTANLRAMDIAKRLIDYGFHPPMVDYPFPGTFLIEPTESECKHELDRFADAMISIRKEIREIERGNQPRVNNVLKNAPHTASMVTAEKWDKPYSRQVAAYPTRYQYIEKYWPAVGRVDKEYADQHLFCTSTPLEFYQ